MVIKELERKRVRRRGERARKRKMGKSPISSKSFCFYNISIYVIDNDFVL